MNFCLQSHQEEEILAQVCAWQGDGGALLRDGSWRHPCNGEKMDGFKYNIWGMKEPKWMMATGGALFIEG